jgi:general stress protein 26
MNHLFFPNKRSNERLTFLTSTSIINFCFKFKKFRHLSICMMIFLYFFSMSNVSAQNKTTSFPKDTLIKAALEIIKASPYCALATIDSNGHPQVRTMNPFPIDNEIVIWFATSRKSRKVAEIKNNPNVSIYYADHSTAKGYVNITATATIIDDKELLVKMKREYWNNIPDWQNRFVLIKIKPITLDVVNYQRGISGDSETSKAPSVVF